jgi:hypothetical protein
MEATCSQGSTQPYQWPEMCRCYCIPSLGADGLPPPCASCSRCVSHSLACLLPQGALLACGIDINSQALSDTAGRRVHSKGTTWLESRHKQPATVLGPAQSHGWMPTAAALQSRLLTLRAALPHQLVGGAAAQRHSICCSSASCRASSSSIGSSKNLLMETCEGRGHHSGERQTRGSASRQAMRRR